MRKKKQLKDKNRLTNRRIFPYLFLELNPSWPIIQVKPTLHLVFKKLALHQVNSKEINQVKQYAPIMYV